MEIKEFNPTQQVDVAVDLAAVPAPLPDWYYLEHAMTKPHVPPPELIEGILHQGCKMVLGGTSKSNKSWCLLDLALSVASGQPWWGRKCAQTRTMYINFELQPWAIDGRLASLCAARPECKVGPEALAIWNLRGHNADLSVLRPRLEEKLRTSNIGLIIIDPAYKVLGNRDENANGEIAALMNEFEALGREVRVAQPGAGASGASGHCGARGD